MHHFSVLLVYQDLLQIVLVLVCQDLFIVNTKLKMVLSWYEIDYRSPHGGGFYWRTIIFLVCFFLATLYKPLPFWYFVCISTPSLLWLQRTTSCCFRKTEQQHNVISIISDNKIFWYIHGDSLSLLRMKELGLQITPSEK